MSSKDISTTKLLAIDDEPGFLGFIADTLSDEKLQILTTTDAETGIDLFLRTRPRIVLLDLAMPRMSGIQVMERILAADPATEVILVTENYSTETALEAIQKGACDLLPKPVEASQLSSRVTALIDEAETRWRTMELDAALIDAYHFEGIVGRSPLMLELFAKVRRIGPHFQSALVSGEAGTGKELIARALHQLSPVRSGPFVACKCSALSQGSVERELSGHTQGAFAGATQEKVGMFEQANGGTIFLDEVGELSLEAQAKLLSVLQNREIQCVGSPSTRPVNARVIATTSKDLKRLVGERKFREDLYYRLSMAEVTVPRMADRREDVPLLLRHFLAKFAAQYGKSITGITRRAQICLGRHYWPGNVRELENVIGNACMMTERTVLDLHDLPESIRSGSNVELAGTVELLSFDELQKRHLLNVLERVGGNKARAAEILGVSRTTIYEMLARIHGDQGVLAAAQRAGSS